MDSAVIEEQPAGARAASISRAERARVSGLFAASLADLRAVLVQHDLPADGAHWCAADLSLGAWTGHQAGRCILDQLGGLGATDRARRAMNPPGQFRRSPSRTIEGAEMIGQLVDSESKGNTGTIEALRLAERTIAALARRIRPVVLVLAPRFSYKWRPDDAAYLRFLAHGVGSTDARLILVACDGVEPSVPDGVAVDWWNKPGDRPSSSSEPKLIAALIPDVPSEALARQTGLFDLPAVGHATLPRGRVLVDPALRVRPTASTRRHFDRLGACDGLDPPLRAYAQLHGSGYFSDSGFLVAQAWVHFTDGDYDIALDIMAYAAASQPPAARGHILYELQGMRIALQRFDEARLVVDPDATQPDTIRAGLYLTKGWALALSGHPVPAREYLEKSRELLHATMGSVRQYLYVKNIYALSLVRTGDWDLALAEEKEIEAALDTHAAETGNRDWPLTYVNALNQARLYKYRRHLDTSLAYYDRGFATTLGARSESDAVYANICRAQVLAEMGQPDAAFVCWFRAGLHWAAAAVPEALALRVASGLLKRHVERSELVADEISQALLVEIDRAAAGRPRSQPTQAPAFRRLDHDVAPSACGDRSLIGATGWAVVIDHRAMDRPASSSQANVRLRLLLTSLIQGAVSQRQLRQAATILVPTQGTGEVPETKAESLLAAARLGVADVVYESLTTSLSPVDRDALLRERRLVHSDAVGSLFREGPDRSVIRFKRYRRALTLTGQAALIFDMLLEPLTLDAVSASLPPDGRGRVQETIEDLEARGALKSLPALG